MNAVKTTHIAEIRQRQANQMDDVCDLLEWSRLNYCLHQFEQYERFCMLLAGRFPDLRRRLRYSAVFRGFWNNEWAQRNATDFLPFAKDSSMGPVWIMDEYHFIHDAERLISDESFAMRFEQIFKSI